MEKNKFKNTEQGIKRPDYGQKEDILLLFI